jgi:two-component system chemotaxis response regulator CheY
MLMDLAFPVLVVDDFRTMTAILCKLLRDVGFTDIDSVSDGPSALDQLLKKKYGLIVSDWNMRPMNGSELIQGIRKDPMHEKTPVIIVSAMDGEDGSRRSGADGYLTKPFMVKDLRETIEEVMSKRAGAV